MNKECAKFIEQLSAPAESRSAELVAHLATCTSCKEKLAIITALQGARAPLSASEISAVSMIANSTQVKTILSSSSLFSAKVLGFGKVTLALVAISLVAIASSISYKNYYKKPTIQINTSLKETSSYATCKINHNSLLFLEKQIKKLRDNLKKSSSLEDRESLSNMIKLLEIGKEINISANELKTLTNSLENTKNTNLIKSKKREYLTLRKDFFQLLNATKVYDKNNFDCNADRDFPSVNIQTTSESEDTL